MWNEADSSAGTLDPSLLAEMLREPSEESPVVLADSCSRPGGNFFLEPKEQAFVIGREPDRRSARTDADQVDPIG